MSENINREVAVWGIPPGETRSGIQTLAPQQQSVPWGIRSARVVDLAPNVTTRSIRVGILDTGIDLAHPDLVTVIAKAVDLTGSNSGSRDVNGHGTHVAGTIGAIRSNDLGLVGMADRVDIYAYKVLDDGGSGTDAWIEAGLRMAIRDECDVVNVSLGGDSQMPGFERLMAEAKEKGIVVVCAAGNGGPSRPRAIFPARYETAVCVASHDRGDGVSSFSQSEPTMDICAPGGAIESTFPGGRYTTMSGTSMATPHVTGAIALIQRRLMVGSMRPTWTQTMDALQRCVRHSTYPTSRVGRGILTMPIEYTSGPWTNAPDPTPAPTMRVDIPLRGLSIELDAALAKGGISSAVVSFVVPRA